MSNSLKMTNPPQLGKYFCSLQPLHINPFSLENLGDRVLMPAFALLFGRYLHDFQEPCNGTRADPFAIHLLDGGDGAHVGCLSVMITANSLI